MTHHRRQLCRSRQFARRHRLLAAPARYPTLTAAIGHGDAGQHIPKTYDLYGSPISRRRPPGRHQPRTASTGLSTCRLRPIEAGPSLHRRGRSGTFAAACRYGDGALLLRHQSWPRASHLGHILCGLLESRHVLPVPEQERGALRGRSGGRLISRRAGPSRNRTYDSVIGRSAHHGQRLLVNNKLRASIDRNPNVYRRRPIGYVGSVHPNAYVATGLGRTKTGRPLMSMRHDRRKLRKVRPSGTASCSPRWNSRTDGQRRHYDPIHQCGRSM